MQRVVKWGDGWMPLNYGPGDEVVAAFDKLRAMAEAAGRDPAQDRHRHVNHGRHRRRGGVGRNRALLEICGVTHLTLATYSGGGHLRGIEGRMLGDHIVVIKRDWNAAGDVL